MTAIEHLQDAEESLQEALATGELNGDQVGSLLLALSSIQDAISGLIDQGQLERISGH